MAGMLGCGGGGGAGGCWFLASVLGVSYSRVDIKNVIDSYNLFKAYYSAYITAIHKRVCTYSSLP